MLNHLINLRWPTTAVFSDDSVTKRSNQYLDLKTEEWNISTKTVNVCEPSDIPTTFFNYVGNPPLFCVFYLYLMRYISSKMKCLRKSGTLMTSIVISF